MPATILAAALYRGYRFPPEIISYAVWLYLRFSLSLQDVEELLADRGVAVSYETIGQWVRAQVRPGVRTGVAAAWPAARR